MPRFKAGETYQGPISSGEPGFGELLRRLRVERGLGTNALGALVSNDQSAISRLETGSRRPSFKTAQALADALGLSGANRVRFLSLAGYIETPLPDALARIIATWQEMTATDTTIAAD